LNKFIVFYQDYHDSFEKQCNNYSTSILLQELL